MVKLIQLSRYQGGRFLLSASAAVKLSANDVVEVISFGNMAFKAV
jgi:hypothetical protein